MDEIMNHMKPTGNLILVKIYKKYKESIHCSFVYPDFHRGGGVIQAMGPDCYKGERFEDQKPWCAVNDIVFCNLIHGWQPFEILVQEDLWLVEDDQITFILEPAAVAEMDEFKEYIAHLMLM